GRRGGEAQRPRHGEGHLSVPGGLPEVPAGRARLPAVHQCRVDLEPAGLPRQARLGGGQPAAAPAREREGSDRRQRLPQAGLRRRAADLPLAAAVPLMRRGWWILIGVLTVAVVLLVVNTIATDAETKPAKADGGRIVALPRGDLQVREDGRPQAPAVVLIHGWTASIRWWDRITPLLASRYHVVRVDLLGHGVSAKPKDGYSMEAQADRVAGALQRLGVRRALIAGHSTGGEVAIA